jgi:LysR family transcriptional regulator of gallate degradation
MLIPMIFRNLRHLRLALSVAELQSLTKASLACFVTQPAASQAIAKLERDAGGLVFDRGPNTLTLTPRGHILVARIKRAMALLDPALNEVAPGLWRTASFAQLQALIAVVEAENFTLAARRLNMAQPTIHRAITQLEQQAGRTLFNRTTSGTLPNRACLALANALRLAFYELTQAEAEMAEFDGREVGHIVIGALPLSRSALLPQALVRFRTLRPNLPVQIIDGPYERLLAGLRHGEIDVIIGALRDPAPIGDIHQEHLFDDSLVLLAGNDHPLAHRHDLALGELARFPWIVPSLGTPTRQQFDALFAQAGIAPPTSILESGSILLMREMLGLSPHLGCISRQQALAEVTKGLLTVLDFATQLPLRPIGLTLRSNWQPTAAQRQMLNLLRDAAPSLAAQRA